MKGSYTVHDLKTWYRPFEAILSGGKRHEIRDNRDRRFEIGDHLRLREWRPSIPGAAYRYTGRVLLVRVQHVTRGGRFGLPTGLDVMTIEPIGGDDDRS